MQLDFLEKIVALSGLSGHEGEVASAIAEAMKPYADEVVIDPHYNVIAHVKGTGPRVMFAAHSDEIGMMVVKIEDDGALRLGSVGGVDNRVLPGQRVTVEATGAGHRAPREDLLGVVGAKAPHLMTADEQKSNYQRIDLHVDLGLPAEVVKQKVNVGDLVRLESRFVKLKNERYTTKTADDRACVAILLMAMQELTKLRPTADLYFVATAQEEIGCIGAALSAYGVDPDIAFALDVTHAATPGSGKTGLADLDSPAATISPFIHPVLHKYLVDTAKDNRIKLQVQTSGSYTGTDADNISIARGGVPTALLELPLKYMHTTVESFDKSALTDTALLCAYVAAGVDQRLLDSLWA